MSSATHTHTHTMGTKFLEKIFIFVALVSVNINDIILSKLDNFPPHASERALNERDEARTHM